MVACASSINLRGSIKETVRDQTGAPPRGHRCSMAGPGSKTGPPRIDSGDSCASNRQLVGMALLRNPRSAPSRYGTACREPS